MTFSTIHVPNKYFRIWVFVRRQNSVLGYRVCEKIKFLPKIGKRNKKISDFLHIEGLYSVAGYHVGL